MKWLVIIAILIVIAVAMVWLRTARQGSEGSDVVRPRQPDRPDESVNPSQTLGPNPRSPISHDPPVAADGTPHDAGKPGSDFAWEPEVTGPDTPDPGADPSRPETRPEA